MITSIEIGDNQQVDYLVANKRSMTEQEIKDICLQEKYIPKWNDFDKTALTANFDHDMVSSYIKNLNKPIKSFIINRRKRGDSRTYKVCEVGSNVFNILDYSIANDTDYNWEIDPTTDDEKGFFSAGEDFQKAEFETWSIIFLKFKKENIYEPIEVWNFKYNLESQPFVQNIEKTQYNNYTQYPKFSIGTNNYITGGISCLLGDIDNNTYLEPVEKFKRWNELIASGAECLIKDTKGNIFKGQITSNQGAQMQHIVSQPPTVISFNFTETGPVDEIQIYKALPNGEKI